MSQFPPQSPIVEQRGRFVHIMRRHVHAEDHAKTDFDMVDSVYARYLKEPELHLSAEYAQPDSAVLFEQRQRYTEIMRRHVQTDDGSHTDRLFVNAVHNRHLYWRGVPLIDPNE